MMTTTNRVATYVVYRRDTLTPNSRSRLCPWALLGSIRPQYPYSFSRPFLDSSWVPQRCKILGTCRWYVAVFGLLRRRHSSYQRATTVCRVPCLEFPSNFGQENPVTACIPPDVEDDTVWHVFSAEWPSSRRVKCPRNTFRVTLWQCQSNLCIVYNNASAGIPVAKKPTGIYRDSVKRPDGVTLVPWQSGRALTWDVTVATTLADSTSQPLPSLQLLQPRLQLPGRKSNTVL